MAKPRMDLSAFVGKLLEEQDGDVLREGVRVLAQALMETRGHGAGRRRAPRAERGPDGLPQRDAGCGRWDTRVGTVELAIPEGPARDATSRRCCSRGAGPSRRC